MQNPAWRDVLTGEAIETGPVEPVPLTSAQQGMPPCAADLTAKAFQPQQVRRNCMVREVAIQDPSKPRTNQRHGFVSPLVELGPDRGQRRLHALFGRQPHDLELSLSVRSTTVGKAQEVERLRSSLPPPASSLDRKAAELDQPRLVRVQGEPELRQPFPKILQEGSRRPHMLKAHHTIVGVANHNDLSSPWLFPPVLNPEIEGVVQIDVRQQGRNHRALRSSLYSGDPLSVFDHSRFEPFADPSNDPLIGNPVFEKPEHPSMIDFFEGTHDTLPTSRSPTKRRSASYEFAILSKANA